jgi:hypothetical protein
MSGWKRGSLELSPQTSAGIRADGFPLRGRGHLDRIQRDPAAGAYSDAALRRDDLDILADPAPTDEVTRATWSRQELQPISQ